MGNIKKTCLVTKEEQIKLVGEGKKWEVALANVPYITVLAKKRTGFGYEIEDLVQAGTIGFWEAMGTYDPSKGANVLSHGSKRTWQAINREIQNHQKTIRIPINVWEEMSVMDSENDRFFLQNGCYLTPAELAERTGFKISKIKELFAAPMGTSSLDGQISSDEPDTFYSLVQDKKVDVETEVMQRALCSDVDAALRRVLNPREYQIVQSYHGLDGHKQLNLREIGVKLGITKERVRQIKKKALGRLEDSSDVEKLRGYLEN